MWIENRRADTKNPVCELCNTEFSVAYKISKECSIKKAFKERLEQTILGSIALMLLTMMSVVTADQSQKISETSGNEKEFRYFLTGICLLGCLILLSIVVHYFRLSFVRRNVVNWRVLAKAENRVLNGPKEGSMKEDISEFRVQECGEEHNNSGCDLREENSLRIPSMRRLSIS